MLQQELEPSLQAFRARVLSRGRELYRDLPWRNTRDPYAIWISEVMLQQTQVSRVDGRWQAWLEHFPSTQVLAAAPVADVLEEWQGLGYNRRALALHKAAQVIESTYGRQMPHELKALTSLPGIGPATAAGIRAFAFNEWGLYLETNVRTVFLHELFPGAEAVSDAVLKPLVEQCCPATDTDPADDPRTWYYALLDYGAYLKKTVPNPSRRSASHVRQSRFEGSHRQKRAEVVRILLSARGGEPLSLAHVANKLNEFEQAAGRPEVESALVRKILDELAREGFCQASAKTADKSTDELRWSCSLTGLSAGGVEKSRGACCGGRCFVSVGRKMCDNLRKLDKSGYRRWKAALRPFGDRKHRGEGLV